MTQSTLDICISKFMASFVSRAGAMTAALGFIAGSGLLISSESAAASSLSGESSPAMASYLLAQSSPTTDDSSSTDSSSTIEPISSDNRFSCEFQNGEYLVMYSPESRPGELYPWASPGAMGGGWSADRRCAEISRRLESYRPDGLLELRTGTENGYDIVCATTEANPSCRIVFTVPPGQDPMMTRDRVFENLAIANSGRDTDAVNTFSGNGSYDILERLGQEIGIGIPSLPGRQRPSSRSSSIDLRPFLDPADGGTGAELRNSSPAQLNPSDFR